MLRLDLAQEPRLLEIETDTRQRLGEAQRMQWLGEVAGPVKCGSASNTTRSASTSPWPADSSAGGD
ncbi:hypothetical protein ACWD3Z_27640 [Streptomyces sp. NPDC002740]